MATKKSKKGLNPEMKLARNLLSRDRLKSVPTRNGYGDGLVEAGMANENLVVLCADLTESTRSQAFKDAFPDRFVQMGIQEQAMASIAAGMALTGKIPFISSYAAFSPGRNWEQIKTNACLQETNVKIAGAHAGLSVGPDGATHQMLEDIAITRVLPNMTVVVPCDAPQTQRATVDGAKRNGPLYLRFARAASPVFTTKQTPFKIGTADVYRFGDDLTLVGAGPILYEALLAADILSKEHGLEARVMNLHTIKPLDEKALVRAAKETGAIVTVEEAQVAGGLAGAVCELLALTTPTPVERIGVQDRYGESGSPDEVLEGLGLTAPSIVQAALRVHARKIGARVPAKRVHIQEAMTHRITMQQNIMSEALKRAPKKWGGTKSLKSLRSRS